MRIVMVVIVYFVLANDEFTQSQKVEVPKGSTAYREISHPRFKI